MNEHPAPKTGALDASITPTGSVAELANTPFDGNGYLAVAGFLYGNSPTDSSAKPPRKVALIRKARPAWQAGKLNGIGGRVNPGETPLDAQVREFREETEVDGLTRDDWRPFAVLSGKDDNGQWTVVFFAARTTQAFDLQTDNDEKPEWLSLVGLLDRSDIVPNLKWLIPLSLDSNMLTAEVKELSK